MRNQSLNIASISLILFSIILWALSFPLLKIGLKVIPPITFAALRFVITTVPFTILMIRKGGLNSLIEPLRKDWPMFFSFGILIVALPNIFQNIGMNLMPEGTAASVASIIQCSTPIFTIILALIFLHESFGFKKWFGAGLSLIGALLLITEGGTTFIGLNVLGNTLILLSAVCYSISGVIGKRALSKYEPLTLLAIGTLVGSVCLGATALFTEQVDAVLDLSITMWSIVLFLGLMVGFIASLLWYMALKRMELSKLILFVYLIPVLAPIISYFMLGELISLQTILLGALIIGGVIIAQYEKN